MPDDRPNVLIFMTDQQRGDVIQVGLRQLDGRHLAQIQKLPRPVHGERCQVGW